MGTKLGKSEFKRMDEIVRDYEVADEREVLRNAPVECLHVMLPPGNWKLSLDPEGDGCRTTIPLSEDVVFEILSKGEMPSLDKRFEVPVVEAYSGRPVSLEFMVRDICIVDNNEFRLSPRKVKSRKDARNHFLIVLKAYLLWASTSKRAPPIANGKLNCSQLIRWIETCEGIPAKFRELRDEARSTYLRQIVVGDLPDWLKVAANSPDFQKSDLSE